MKTTKEDIFLCDNPDPEKAYKKIQFKDFEYPEYIPIIDEE